MPKPKEIFAFIDDGPDGGIVGIVSPMSAQLVTTDRTKLPMYRELADQVQRACGRTIRCYRFTVAEEFNGD